MKGEERQSVLSGSWTLMLFMDIRNAEGDTKEVVILKSHSPEGLGLVFSRLRGAMVLCGSRVGRVIPLKVYPWQEE